MRNKLARVFYMLIVSTILLSLIGLRTTSVSASATFTVNSTVDAVDIKPGDGICATAAGTCTLRAAVQETNALGGSNTVNLPAGTYILTIPGANENNAVTGDLDIKNNLTIIGAGIGVTIVDANQLDRAFHVWSGYTLILSGATIQNGVANPGGGILVNGSATITSVAFKNNQSPSTTGPSGSSSSGDGVGGAIYVDKGATAAINLSQFSNNLANFGGGAISSLNDSSFTVNNSTFTSNNGGYYGGAIFPDGASATITNSTFISNSAVTGGAIESSATTVTVTNSTFASNSATTSGAIDAGGGTATINNSTFSGNSASGNGDTFGAQSSSNGNGYIQVENSILSGSDTNNCITTNNKIIDLGHNLSWPSGNTCPGTQADPMLAPLADNGGPTYTMALVTGSPAIDAGDNSTCTNVDQRGISRPQPAGGICDIGAFESIQTLFVVTNTNDSGTGSLRKAISDANSTPNTSTKPDQIEFNIPGSGVETISLLSSLPPFTSPVIIDGYTQPGTTTNTLATGSNAVLLIQLDGTNIPGSTALNLTTGSDGSLVRGLVINNGFGTGILVNGGAQGIIIQGNYIGTTPSGLAVSSIPDGSYGSGQAGVYVDNSPKTQIGGTTPAQRNVIAGNNSDGIALVNAGTIGTIVVGNYIGVGADGTTALPNGGSGGSFGTDGGGITLRNSTSNTVIGGSKSGNGNLIANNAPYGIVDYSGTNTTVQGNTITNQTVRGVFLSGTQQTITNNTISENKGPGLFLAGTQITVQNNVILSNNGAGVVVGTGGNNVVIHDNSIFNNGSVGIDLGNDGASFDHTGTISGPNDYQNYPIINLATSNGITLRVVGSLVSPANQNYNIDVYATTACDATSFGQGKTYLGTFPVTTDANGQASFDQTLSSIPAGVTNEPNFITATATGSNGTSEFSYCLPVATANLNWVQALSVSGTSVTQQYMTAWFQEKWFMFPVQPGEKVTVTLNGLPGSAISLHKDPNAIYNELINPKNSTALSADAADSAFLPSGSLPSGSLPSGSLPSGSLPSGSLPSGSLSSYFLPSGSLPYASLPSGSLPSGSLPSGSLPSGSLPSGSLPSGSLPSGSLPSGSLPVWALPSGSLPSGSLPSGSLPSGSLPSGSLPSGSLPSGSLPSGSLPSGSLAAYDYAARLSLLGISMDPSATVQTISRDTYDYQGNLYVRIVGPFNLSTPFTLTVTVAGGVCANIQPVPGNLAVINGSTPAGNLQTLILTDSSRLNGTSTEISTALSDLQTLAARSDVNGTVIDLSNSIYQRVAWANAQADQNPACPAAKNMVATEIKSVIDAYRAANSSSGSTTLQYIVLAGGADVIPYYQVPDLAGLANEDNYIVPVAPSTPSEAGIANNLVEGQDFYGSQTNVTQGGFTLALPNLAVGRLVESAADISIAVNTYIATNGVITPHSSLVTGYDFVADAAQHIADELTAGTGTSADTLIQPVGQPPSGPNAWTASQLLNALQSSRHDIISFSGHFSASNLLASDYSTQLSPAQIIASQVDLKNVLVLALGCHSGYTLADSDLLSGISPNPDWAKAFLQQGAAGYIASTAYAYGDTDLTAYGEQLFWDLAQQLRTGSGPVAIGQALVAAKHQYLAQNAQLTGIDQKTLIETSLYGLPMMKVDMPGTRITPSADTSIVSTTNPVTTGPTANVLSSALVGLTFSTQGSNPNLFSHTTTLQDLSTNTSITATYLSGLNGTISNPFEPIYPMESYNVDVPNLVLRGAALRGGTYTDLTGVVPLTTAATTETSVAHLSFNTPVFYPTQTWMANFNSALSGGNTHLIAIPAQFQSTAPGAIDGILRTFNQMNLQLFYLPSNLTDSSSPAAIKAAAVSAAPNIMGASAVLNQDGTVTFYVNASANQSSGVLTVWVLYTSKSTSSYYGTWAPLDLTLDPVDPTLWEGTLTLQAGVNPQDLLFMVQAVGGGGLTTLATNLGAYYTINSDTTKVPTVLSLQTPPSSGTFLKTSSFNVSLTSSGQPLAGQLVTVNIGGQQSLAITDSNGHATISLNPVVAPGSYVVQASFGGSSNYLSSHASSPFTLNKDTTSVTVSPSSATAPFNAALSEQPTPIVAKVLDSSGHPLGGVSVVFIVHNSTVTYVHSVIADYLGNASLGAVPLPLGTYTVDAYFDGTIPISSSTSLNLSDIYYVSSKLLGSSLTLADVPPQITASAKNADGTAYSAGTWTNQDVTVHFTCTDEGSGLASCTADQSYTAEGTYTAQGTATDSNHASTTTSFGPIQIDLTAPTISASATNADGTTYTAGTWTNQAVTVHFTCNDTGSGVTLCPANQVYTKDGTYTAQGTVSDNAGNTASASFGPVQVDQTPPTIVAASTTQPNAAGWYNTDVTVHFTCTDTGSGIPSGACPADQTLSTEGTGVSSTVETVTDAAGNTSAASNVVTVQIDKTAPAISASATKADNTAYTAGTWTNQTVTVHFTCSDTGSGITSCPDDLVLSSDGVTPVTGKAIDAAGNSASVNFGSVEIDKTAPTITASISSGTQGTNGWFVSDVTVHFTCSDGSGSQFTEGACPPDQILSIEGSAVSSTAKTVTDMAGNTSAPSNVITVQIDKTPPTLNAVVNPNPIILNDSTATVTPGATDALSGIASQSCDALVTDSVGPKSVTCTASDMAGNTTSIAIAYNVIYQFVGFLQPVDDTGRLSICGSPCPISIFRGGSTIPIKFQLEDANGNIVQSASLPIWITPVQGAATNLSINTSNYKGPGTSGADYTYNVTGQQYEFDWNTKGYATGYLWIIGAQLDDGQTYTVTIGLK